MNLFDLAAKITLDSSAYESGIKEAESTGKRFSEKLKSGLGTAAKVGAASVVAFGTAAVSVGTAAVSVGKKLYSEVSDLAAYGDQIDKNSQKMGISAKAYQEWDFILQHSGSSIDAMSRGMITLSKQAESNSDAFEQLGITQEDLATLNKEDLFAKTIEGLRALGEGTERDAIAAQLFGGSAKELGPLLNTSAEEVAAMRKQVNDLGGVMSNKAVKDAAKFQDSLQDMKTAFDGIKRNLTSQFLPSFSGVFKNLAGILTSSGKDAEKYQKGLAKNFGKIASDIVNEIPKIVQTAGKIGLALIDSMSSTLTKNSSKIIRTGLSVIKDLASDLISRIPDLMGGIGSIIGDVIANIPNILELGAEIIFNLGRGIIEGIPKAFQGIKDGFEGMLKKPFSQEVNDAIGELDKLGERINGIGMSSNEMYEKIAGADADQGMAQYWFEVFETLRNKTELTKTEQEKLNSAVEYLNTNVLPETQQIVQDESGKWQANTAAILDNIEAMKQRQYAEIYLEKMRGQMEKMVEIDIELNKQEKELSELEAKKESLIAPLEEVTKQYQDYRKEVDDLFESNENAVFSYEAGSDRLKEYAKSVGITEENFRDWNQVTALMLEQQQEVQREFDSTNNAIDAHNSAIFVLKKSYNMLEESVDKYADKAADAQSKAHGVGSDMGKGVAKGIRDSIPDVEKAAYSLSNAAIKKMKAVAQIASPSKRARKEIGQQIGEGERLGLLDKIPGIEKASEALIEASMGEVRPRMSLYKYGKERANSSVPATAKPIYMVLDSGELVGSTATKMDTSLGKLNAIQLRWEGAAV